VTDPTPHQRLTRAGLSAQFADLVLNQHAHQLAEQQRKHWMPRPPGETADYVRGLDDGFDKAADLIDPENEAQR
jgi:hypothetical protein